LHEIGNFETRLVRAERLRYTQAPVHPLDEGVGAMRKRLTIAAIIAATIAVGGYFYFKRTPETRTVPVSNIVRNGPKDDGDAEASEAIEPLRVGASVEPSPAPSIDEGPMPTVALEPGQQQPPRPDTEPGTRLRMPYADEEAGFAEIRIGHNLARLNIFELIDNTNRQLSLEPKPIPDYLLQDGPASIVPHGLPRGESK
jgi:hypothetical protein